MSVFNRCVQTLHVLPTLECWAEVHPSLVTIPVDWDFSIPYGILYQLQPDDDIQRFLSSVFSIRLKKQFGISLWCRFLLIHGAHPLLCFVGCNGQFRFLQVQNLLIFSISLFVQPCQQANFSNTDTTYSAISQSCSSVPPPIPIPPAILPFTNNG